MKRCIFILSLLITCTQTILSQDNHYWSQQFGAVSSLMGGAMVAGVRDNSAAFYNPGALTFIDFPNLSVDANLYKLDKILITDGAGSGINLNSAQVNIYPQILTGMINYIKVPGLKFSYSILTRNFSNILMSTRYTKSEQGMQGSEPNRFLGEFNYVNQLNEQWFGLCASYKLKEGLGIGVTLFGVYRGQTFSITDNLREVSAADSISSLEITNNTESIKYMTFGFLAKFGLAWETGKWRFGVSLTTPSVGLYGNGSAKREESSYISSASSPVQKTPYYILAENTSTKARYYHPLAIGFGIEFHSPKTRVALSGEYFSKITSYYVLKPSSDPFVYPSGIRDSAGMSGKIDQFLYVGNAAKPVFNLGFGFSQALGKHFDLLLGARTDFSSYTQPEYVNELLPKTALWDLYYLSSGLSYHQTRQSITLGFSYSFSPSKQIDPVVILSPGSANTAKANAFQQSFGIVLGYTHYFPR
ncbi:MAG: hypothetical protein NTW10_06460 [Bacteroidetes bacterium]|nr:hypothetical protein [Bacteroidota bacterium]